MSERNETDDRLDDAVLERIRANYNVPGDTPVSAMWSAIDARIDEGQVIDIASARSERIAPASGPGGPSRPPRCSCSVSESVA